MHSEKTLTRSPRTAARQSARVTRVQFHQKLVELARHCLTNDCILVASPLLKGFMVFRLMPVSRLRRDSRSPSPGNGDSGRDEVG